MPCTTILVGKNVSADGSTMIARNDDGGFETKKLTVFPAQKQPKPYRSVLSHMTVEMPENAMRFTAAPNVSKKDGQWAACGINEANVAMTATETITSNPRVLGADPYVRYVAKKSPRSKVTTGGIGEEDLVMLVLPYIRTAREGVLRMAELLKTYGTYEPNGMAFSDADEIWWMETIGGHHWIAARVPDDRVVIMPNQFGLDHFDWDDALGEKKHFMCSDDLKAFTEQHHLALDLDEGFNPRLAYGSHSDADHIYNTPRAWYMARCLMPTACAWDGEYADFTPESDDLPWSFTPEHKVTVEEMKYILSSYYQGTPYNPYSKGDSPLKGKYRVIGVPNSDVSILLQIRGDRPEMLRGIEWVSMGGSGFTACFPVYAQVDKFPAYLSATPETVSTDSMYWSSRLISALTDAHFGTALLMDERYQETVFCRGRELLNRFDAECSGTCDAKALEKANQSIADMVREETLKALGQILTNANNHMKTKYYRGDH